MRKYKTITIAVVTAVFALLFLLRADIVSESVKGSMELCYMSVIPSLFPFFILCEFLMLTLGGVFKNIGVTAFLTGLIAGFPTGVNNVCTLYKNGHIEKEHATALIHASANASPAYLLAFIGKSIMGSTRAGVILFISQAVCAFACAVFFGCFKKRDAKCANHGVISLTDAACKSVSNSVSSCLYICGYIVFFGLIADILTGIGYVEFWQRVLFFLPRHTVKAVSLGVIEITRGIKAANGSLPLTAAVVGFSGISVIMQCISCTVKVGLSSGAVIISKLSYAMLLPLFAMCLDKLMPQMQSKNEPTAPFIAFFMFLIFIVFCIIFIYNSFDKSSKRIYNRKNKVRMDIK